MAFVLNLNKSSVGLYLAGRHHVRTQLQFTRQLKSDLKIKWVRPEKIPSIRPEMSGDLKLLGTLDMTQLPSTHRASTELQSADDTLKRLYSLEFFNRQKHKEEFMIEYANRVKSNKHDDYSPEVKIARLTVSVRNLQIHMAQYSNDKINKVRLKQIIDKRNQLVARLRKVDYKKYEWLLEKLDVQHKPFWFNCDERVERKKSLRRLTMLFIEKVKAERLSQYKDYLQSQKEDFLKEKLEKLVWMKKTEEDYGFEPTVVEADIEAVLRQMKELRIVEPKAISE